MIVEKTMQTRFQDSTFYIKKMVGIWNIIEKNHKFVYMLHLCFIKL